MAEALEDEWQWDDLCVVVETNLADWGDQFAEVFAGTLSFKTGSPSTAACAPSRK
jgi:hypothetical protein